jgi:hypothetical protein
LNVVPIARSTRLRFGGFTARIIRRSVGEMSLRVTVNIFI